MNRVGKNDLHNLYVLMFEYFSHFVRAFVVLLFILCLLTLLKLKYCNKFAGSVSQWKFITLKVQYTTLDYGSQLF
jgi:hypothetical protein